MLTAPRSSHAGCPAGACGRVAGLWAPPVCLSTPCWSHGARAEPGPNHVSQSLLQRTGGPGTHVTSTFFPHTYCICRCVVPRALYLTHLEDIGQIPEVEYVVELDGRGQEVVGHLAVEGDGGLDRCRASLQNRGAEGLLLQVATQNLAVDGLQGISRREVHGEH